MSVYRRVVYGFGALFGHAKARAMWKDTERRMEENAQQAEAERKKKAKEDADRIRDFQQRRSQ